MRWRGAIISLLVGLAAATSFAQGSATESATTYAATIEPLLAAKPSAKRDRRLYELAVALFKSIEAGAEKDVDEARRVMARALREAAEGDVPEAWIDYGRCLWNGWGVPRDREAGLAAYKKAAALGSDYGAYLAAYNLYWEFRRYDEAYTFARRAQRGDESGETHYLLGLMAYTGRGRPKDIRESLHLHQQAARLGNADAMFELYAFSMMGIGDREGAVFFLKRAAQLEQPRAMANLGVLYATGGLGFPKDLAESVRWYRRASDKGHPQAAATLGLMTLRGEGTPKDAAAAEAMFARAEELGFDVESYLRKNGIERQ